MVADMDVSPKPQPLPRDLPVPIDDGRAAHLRGLHVPDLVFPSPEVGPIDLRAISRALVLYVFPKIGAPDVPDPDGWDDVPGARGCTQQSCAFRDNKGRFAKLGYAVAGLSAQPIEEQQEAATRLHLPFPLLADPERDLARALDLPTWQIAGMNLYKRLTLVIENGVIVKVFYPVFPPDENADELLGWLERASIS
jgi:peroxiredoxin